ncbi:MULTISPECIES: LysR family transcriptional regulator [Bradyrhizobium]|uniref:LysR family transcriptional regulator n=1 Tax=Bradyrhizobium TaxID=374 RepID=UPI0018AD5914|nr:MULTISPECIES: LysR family transcriptional regulator [Bradyrhizobium]MCS3453721.1 DNA-binding transcriptional LysR family regulator [Bradyrhizobium elkanii]MCS3564172.1 DNA-binding transcriptional LysR family regulator [Bradyrhizobium elkanii]MCW2145996.1 DNA-binding transcriptional LysR family regulator [Bradyrhizobium elkanii]MCW2354931.1 DNA-binding transcriptional LysR family regulator [Bradyrhizobium elkanii]MCW2378823.1 DNA-binding transcriptional LysR family regulator [Bradyrhizobium 
MNRGHRLEMLISAADSGSFAAAARIMDLTPSAVSRGIAELERELKVPLFNRTTRQLKLTQEGADVYRRAVDIVARIAELTDGFTNRRGRVSGIVRVGVQAPLSRYVLMPRLASLNDRHPELLVETRLTQDPRDMQSENLDVLLYVGEPPPSRLVAQRLGQGKPAAYASPDYVRRFGAPEHPADLVNHRCLLFRPAWSTGPFDHWKFERKGKLETIRVRPSFVTPDREGLIVAACAGAGVIYMACFDPAILTAGRLTRLLPEWSCPPSFGIHVMYRRGSTGIPRVAAFLRFLREAFADFDPDELTVLHADAVAKFSSPPRVALAKV